MRHAFDARGRRIGREFLFVAADADGKRNARLRVVRGFSRRRLRARANIRQQLRAIPPDRRTRRHVARVRLRMRERIVQHQKAAKRMPEQHAGARRNLRAGLDGARQGLVHEGLERLRAAGVERLALRVVRHAPAVARRRGEVAKTLAFIEKGVVVGGDGGYRHRSDELRLQARRAHSERESRVAVEQHEQRRCAARRRSRRVIQPDAIARPVRRGVDHERFGVGKQGVCTS